MHPVLSQESNRGAAPVTPPGTGGPWTLDSGAIGSATEILRSGGGSHPFRLARRPSDADAPGTGKAGVLKGDA